METVYVGLGGNVGDAVATITKAALAIQVLPSTKEFSISKYYLTTPVSPIPQNNYINAVCSFKTPLAPTVLFEELEDISIKLGKTPKPKEAPRIIDLDLLFFGERLINDKNLQVPHPQWKNRLFVLVPLLDLTEEIIVPTTQGKILFNLRDYVQNFPNPHNEIIVSLNENFNRGINESEAKAETVTSSSY